MRLLNLFVLFCVLGLLVLPYAQHVTAQAGASDDEVAVDDAPESGSDASSDYEEELGNQELGPAEDLKTSFLFTEQSEKAIPAGSIVRSLIGVSNVGDSSFYVLAVEGSFRYPSDFKYHVQNFTAKDYNVTVAPSTQASLEYAFRPDPDYDPRKFGLVINLYYTDASGKTYIDAVFNNTVEVVEPNEPFQAETFFLYVTLVAIVGLSGFYASKAFSGSGKKKSSKASSSSATEVGTRSNGASSEWLSNVNEPKTAGKPKRK